ncbi:ubiquitin carboxyl-terminal hydrolase 36-like [Gordionus sp. m RMFG-2023]|uniref:ubiquitin carboxyl-terminal hydrolase 36-like n=1 Tax=Gordionus sp. m RMFG-2023 TaxID=3053472 RepID=UPI0031FC7459
MNKNNSKIDEIPNPQCTIFSPDNLEMAWTDNYKIIGSGLANLGNTCYMNSTLQCLTYTPPLANYFIKHPHIENCHVQGFCMECEIGKHIKFSLSKVYNVYKPLNILRNLKCIAKHFNPYKQEDAHEFFIHIVEAMHKSGVNGYSKLDKFSKQTTMINQIFGGYLRSRVICKMCQKPSDCYDPFVDISLDVKGTFNLNVALKRFIAPEIIQNENAYKCEECKRKVPAQKCVTIHRPPRVGVFHLKRFTASGNKITHFFEYPERLDMTPYLSHDCKEQASNDLVINMHYRLYAVLVHSGYSTNYGHYFCYCKAQNGFWYRMDDANVTQTSLQKVLSQEAYILFYIQEDNDIKNFHNNKAHPNHILSNGVASSIFYKNQSSIQNNTNSIKARQDINNNSILGPSSNDVATKSHLDIGANSNDMAIKSPLNNREIKYGSQSNLRHASLNDNLKPKIINGLTHMLVPYPESPPTPNLENLKNLNPTSNSKMPSNNMDETTSNDKSNGTNKKWKDFNSKYNSLAASFGINRSSTSHSNGNDNQNYGAATEKLTNTPNPAKHSKISFSLFSGKSPVLAITPFKNNSSNSSKVSTTSLDQSSSAKVDNTPSENNFNLNNNDSNNINNDTLSNEELGKRVHGNLKIIIKKKNQIDNSRCTSYIAELCDDNNHIPSKSQPNSTKVIMNTNRKSSNEPIDTTESITNLEPILDQSAKILDSSTRTNSNDSELYKRKHSRRHRDHKNRHKEHKNREKKLRIEINNGKSLLSGSSTNSNKHPPKSELGVRLSQTLNNGLEDCEDERKKPHKHKKKKRKRSRERLVDSSRIRAAANDEIVDNRKIENLDQLTNNVRSDDGKKDTKNMIATIVNAADSEKNNQTQGASSLYTFPFKKDVKPTNTMHYNNAADIITNSTHSPVTNFDKNQSLKLYLSQNKLSPYSKNFGSNRNKVRTLEDLNNNPTEAADNIFNSSYNNKINQPKKFRRNYSFNDLNGNANRHSKSSNKEKTLFIFPKNPFQSFLDNKLK